MKRLWFWALILVAAGCGDLPHDAAFDPNAPLKKQAPGRVTGMVTLENETDFSQISVQLRNSAHTYLGQTLQDGSVDIAGVAPGSYQVTYSARFFEELHETLVVPLGEAAALPQRMLPARRATVQGLATIVDEAGQHRGGVTLRFRRTGSLRGAAPAPGLQFLAEQDNGPAISTVSSSNGEFSLPSVPMGVYAVVAQVDGLGSQELPPLQVTGEKPSVTLADVVVQPMFGRLTVLGKNAAGYVNQRTVTLSLDATGSPQTVEIAFDPGFLTALPAFAFAPTAAVTLPAGDGLKSVYARYYDGDGNVSSVGGDTVLLDTAAPQIASVAIAEGNPTRSSTLHVTVTAIEAAELSVGATCASGWAIFNRASTYPLPSTAPGQYPVVVAVRDIAGNVSDCVNEVITYDPTPPAYTAAKAIVIDGDALSTTHRLVSVALAVTDATEIQLSENPTFAGAVWSPAITATTLSLSSPGDGVKTIYLRARDAAGNESAPQSDSILLDTTPPEFYSVSAPGLVNVQGITLALSGQDATSARISDDPAFGGAAWIPYASSMTTVISGGDGTKTVFVQLRDDAGNLSISRAVSVVLDQTAPEAPSVSVLEGLYIKNPSVSLQIIANDAHDVLVSQYVPMTDATWQPFGVLKSFTLTGADGPKTIYTRVRDAAGNQSAPSPVTVALDRTAPMITLFQAENPAGAPLSGTNATQVLLRLTASDASPRTVQFNNVNLFSGAAATPMTAATIVQSWALAPAASPAGELRTVYTRVADAAGNETVAGPLTLWVDTVPPANPAIALAAAVSSTTIPIALSAQSADFAEVAGDPLFLTAVRFSMRATTDFTVPSGDGTKTVYARFADAAGNYSYAVSASTVLDTVAPTLTSFTIDEAPLTPLLAVHINVAATGASQMQAGEGGCTNPWNAYSPTAAYSFRSQVDGVKEISVQLRDNAGNTTACYSRTITLDTSAPYVTSMSPRSAGAGREITINGINFGQTQGTNTVTFKGIDAVVTFWSNTEVRAIVPGAALPGTGTMILHVNGRDSQPVSFVIAPAIVTLEPAFGAVGTTLVVRGTAFNTSQGGSSLFFNGVPATVSVWNNNFITAVVPAPLPRGLNSVTVALDLENLISVPAFYVVQPHLDALTPATAAAGATLTVTGTNFGTTQGTSELLIGGAPAGIVSWSDSTLVITLPAALQPGRKPVRFAGGDGTLSNSVDLDIAGPHIDWRYPEWGDANTSVTLVGSGFGVTQGTVSIGGVAATVSQWTDGLVEVSVPAGVTKGRQRIVLQTSGGIAANQVALTQRGSDVWVGDDLPASRSNMVYGWTGTELIVWGGNFPSGGRYNPTTDSWLTCTTAGAPPGHSGATGVWTGTELIVWAGMDSQNTSTNTNTGGRYNPATDSWTATNSALGTLPNVVPYNRSTASAVWTGTEMIVFGGIQNPFSTIGLADGGRYNPLTDSWVRTSNTNAPSARWGHSAVWTGKQMLIWGGNSNGTLTNTGSRYDPQTDTWTAMATNGAPTARYNSPAVWTGAEMILFGGYDGSSSLNTGGRYNPYTDSWKPTNPTGNPGYRNRHTAVWTGSEVLIFGGLTSGSSFSTNTGGRYNPATDTWSAMDAGASAPEARDTHAAVWTGSEMLVWGGYHSGYGMLSSGGRYHPESNTWTPTGLGPRPLTARSYPVVVWTGSEMIVWGGLQSSGATNTGMRYNPASDTWTPTDTTGAPLLRYYHAGVWTGSQMVVWGGWASSALNTGGRYDPATNSWQATAFGPSGRIRHSMVWTGTEAIIWGGNTSAFSGTNLNDGYRYNPVSNTWSATAVTAGTPGIRYTHSAVWTGTEMIVWGGWNGSSYINTGGRYNPVANTWIPTSTGANVPNARANFTALWTGDRMLIWGGDGSNNYGAAYFPAGDTWSTLPLAPVNSRGGLVAVWTGQEAIYWGGSDNRGAVFNVAGDTWRPTSMAEGVPVARVSGAAVWAGDRMIVVGGGGMLSNVAFYFP